MHTLIALALFALPLTASTTAPWADGDPHPSPPIAAAPAAQADPLPSWNEGAARDAIVDFVSRTTTEGSPDLVPAADRIAVFDNDGTLWCERPMPVQLAFAIDRVHAMAGDHPEWSTTEPFASILRGDLASALSGGTKSLLEIVDATHSEMTPDEFESLAREWIAAARHATLGRRHLDAVYQPMTELLAYLRANGFTTYIVSGGGADFMRAFAEDVYGIPPAQVIGSLGNLAFDRRDGAPVLVKKPGLAWMDDKEGKPIAIRRLVGKRPILAFGNSDGDLAMIEWTTAGAGPRLGLLVHHDDAGREFAYDRDHGIGALDKGLDLAPARGWILVSMRKDWRRVFAEAAGGAPSGG